MSPTVAQMNRVGAYKMPNSSRMGPSAVAAHATTAFSPVEVHVISPVKLPLHLARSPRELKGVEFCSKECHEILKF